MTARFCACTSRLSPWKLWSSGSWLLHLVLICLLSLAHTKENHLRREATFIILLACSISSREKAKSQLRLLHDLWYVHLCKNKAAFKQWVAVSTKLSILFVFVCAWLLVYCYRWGRTSCRRARAWGTWRPSTTCCWALSSIHYEDSCCLSLNNACVLATATLSCCSL